MDYFRELNFVSVALRLLLSAVIGFSLGLERGRKRRPAGCRTYMLVCMGATLTLLLSQYEYIMVTTKWASIASEIGLRTDVSRFGAQVINGVGFLGAGTILVTGRREVKGLTTAAGLWASACMGLAIGAGFYECVFLGTVLIFLSMRYLPSIENRMVERAPFLNIYVEFESLDNIGLIISRIKEKNSQILDVEIEPAGAKEMARRSRGTPRLANRILKRVRDFAQVKYDGIITEEVARTALDLMDVDKMGLDHIDRNILVTIIEKFDGGPVGLDTLAAAIGEDAGTIEDVYEPYLIKNGFLNRTPKGRVVTDLTYHHLGLN